MTSSIKLAVVACSLTVACLVFARDPAPSTPVGQDELDEPIRKNEQAFVDAYARRDAEAIGQLFTEDAEFFNEFGDRTVGRAEITALFQNVFDTTPDALIEAIDIETVRSISDTVRLEEGYVTTTPFRGAPPEISRYLAVHIREQDGVWRIKALRDHSRERSSAAEQLSQLAWLVGEWVSEDSAATVHTNCDWSEDGNYLLRSFAVETAGGLGLDGVQRIGWDPLRRQIRSWTFDSGGGFTEGTWRRNGQDWVVTSSGVTADGESASGVAVYSRYDAERFSWQFRSLVIGPTVEENSEPVVMVRRPPAPQSAE